jgi:Flp pilus assembly protein TadG
MGHSDKNPRSRRAVRGQAIAEFALLLPLLVGLIGGAVDFARAYEGSMTLESATRNAAEAAAFEATTKAQAQIKAQEVVCTEAQRLPGFVAGSGGVVATCTNPTVTVDEYVRDISSPGANERYPLVTVTVTTSLDFALIVPWPFLPHGAWTLGTTQSFEIIQGR